MSAQPWVCSSCRSINQPREGRCYRCRTPRALVEADPETLLVAGAGSRPTQEPRPTGTYRSSADLAFVAQLLTGAALVTTTFGTILNADLVGRVLDGEVVTGDTSATTVALVGGVGLLVAGAALVVFALWLSRVVANVPTIGLGWTNVTPTQAIFETVVPGVNLYRVPAVIRDVAQRLEPHGRGEALLAAAWLGLVGGVLLPRLAGTGIIFLFGSIDDFVGLRLLAGQLALGLTIIGGVFLIALVQWVETRMAAKAREPEAPAADAAPAAERPAAPAAAPAPGPDADLAARTPAAPPSGSHAPSLDAPPAPAPGPTPSPSAHWTVAAGQGRIRADPPVTEARKPAPDDSAP